MTAIKNKELNKLTTPNYMWVIFNTGHGAQAAQEKETFKFGTHKFHVKRAPNPTDIKYENVKITKENHSRRKKCALFFVFLFGIAFFFIGQVLIKQMQVIGFMQQPPLTDCKDILKRYDDEALLSLAY